ncbi:hypothetical protein MXB_2686 [Myxobolus squamalis]|nr:hypothetical protein MXB_2686 [Myxobolus squamalis]
MNTFKIKMWSYRVWENIETHSPLLTYTVNLLGKSSIKLKIVCSASGTVTSERRRAPYFVQWIVFPLISSVLSDMQVMEELLQNSDICYVVILPYTGNYTVEEGSVFESGHSKNNEYDNKMVTIGTKE